MGFLNIKIWLQQTVFTICSILHDHYDKIITMKYLTQENDEQYTGFSTSINYKMGQQAPVDKIKFWPEIYFSSVILKMWYY